MGFDTVDGDLRGDLIYGIFFVYIFIIWDLASMILQILLAEIDRFSIDI